MPRTSAGSIDCRRIARMGSRRPEITPGSSRLLRCIRSGRHISFKIVGFHDDDVAAELRSRMQDNLRRPWAWADGLSRRGG